MTPAGSVHRGPTDEIAELADLRDGEALTGDEFETQKQKILGTCGRARAAAFRARGAPKPPLIEHARADAHPQRRWDRTCFASVTSSATLVEAGSRDRTAPTDWPA